MQTDLQGRLRNFRIKDGLLRKYPENRLQPEHDLRNENVRQFSALARLFV